MSEHRQSLIKACEERIAQWKKDPMGMEYPSIPLTVPHAATGDQIRLCGRSGPYSQAYANYREGHGSTGYWDARKVLKFLKSVDKTVTTD